MISVIAVSYHSKDWEELLRQSLARHAHGEYELIIEDNSNTNRGHGKAMDDGIAKAKYPYILAMDIDAHVVMPGWDAAIVRAFEASPEGTEIIAAKGGLLKPIRPCTMVFRRDWYVAIGGSFLPKNYDGAKLDVGIHFYIHTLSEAGRVEFMPQRKSELFEGVWGEEYLLNGEPFSYHNWYGTRWHPNHTEIDGRKYTDFEAAKLRLFEQLDYEITPLVR